MLVTCGGNSELGEESNSDIRCLYVDETQGHGPVSAEKILHIDRNRERSRYNSCQVQCSSDIRLRDCDIFHFDINFLEEESRLRLRRGMNTPSHGMQKHQSMELKVQDGLLLKDPGGRYMHHRPEVGLRHFVLPKKEIR
jgi:hypothetical protein